MLAVIPAAVPAVCMLAAMAAAALPGVAKQAVAPATVVFAGMLAFVVLAAVPVS